MAETSPKLAEWIAASLRAQEADHAARAAITQAWTEARPTDAPLDDKAALRGFVQHMRQTGYGPLLPDLLADLTSRLPNAAWAWIQAAEAAGAAGDHDRMRALADTIRSRFPAVPAGARLAIQAALQSGHLDDVAAVLAATPAGREDEDAALAGRIALAERDGDHPAALAAGLALAARKPKRPDGSLAIIRALVRLSRLDEAEARAATLLPLHPFSAAMAQEAAEIAEARGDHEAALIRWAEMRKRSRATPVAFLGTLRCLRATKRMDLAMPVLYEALARFPDHLELLVTAARIAEGAVQVEDADLFWQRAVRLAPDDPALALSAALCLIGSPAGRPARMPEVLHRLQAHHAAFPDFAEAYAAHVNALRMARHPALAIATSASWCDAFPDIPAIALARAGAYEDLGRPDLALAEVQALRGRMPATMDLELVTVRALSVAGLHDQADAACAACLTAHPGNARALLEHARISTRRGDWEQAHARLLDAQKRLPDNDKIAHELQLLRQQRAEPEPDAPPESETPALFARFESLGGTGVSCEFAMIQRQQGADRVGLLRWSRNEVHHLLDALAAEFEGVGSEESTVLKTARHGPDNEEYVTQDRRYFMESHTFVQTSDAPAESMFRQTCRRLRFLRGKLLEDLRAADRIFVFKAHQTGHRGGIADAAYRAAGLCG